MTVVQLHQPDGNASDEELMLQLASKGRTRWGGCTRATRPSFSISPPNHWTGQRLRNSSRRFLAVRRHADMFNPDPGNVRSWALQIARYRIALPSCGGSAAGRLLNRIQRFATSSTSRTATPIRLRRPDTSSKQPHRARLWASFHHFSARRSAWPFGRPEPSGTRAAPASAVHPGDSGRAEHTRASLGA
jgi:hypothetical protein